MKIASTFFLIILSAWATQAATYYVATNGNDGNSGTELKKPLRTIAYAVDKMVAGDTTYVRSGIYFETVNVRFKNSGSSTAPIRLIAYNTEKPIIDFSKASNARVSLLNSRGEKYAIGYIWIEGFEIRNGAVGIHLYSAHNSTLKRNWIHHSVAHGMLGNGKNILVDRNIINRNGDFARCAQESNRCNQQHGMYVTGTNWTITNNLIYDNLAWGIHVAGYEHCPQGGCYGGSPGAPAKVYAGPEYGGASNWLIANNTIAYNNYRGAITLWLPLTTNIKIVNNIFYENNQKLRGTTQGIDFLSSGGGHILQNNISYATAPGGTAFLNADAVGKYTASGNIVNTLSPKFVNAPAAIPSSPNFTLTASSPAINRGVTSAVKFDFLGVARPKGGVYDIGAYEFTTGNLGRVPASVTGFRVSE